jgi:hypothetical protein
MSEYQFVLVHGSWHDGSLWEPVAGRLRELGHAVDTPTIAGHGKGVYKAVTHEDCVRSIVDAIVRLMGSAVPRCRPRRGPWPLPGGAAA